jgi:hypothetical protein
MIKLRLPGDLLTASHREDRSEALAEIVHCNKEA